MNKLIALIENIYSINDKHYHDLLYIYNISLDEKAVLVAEEGLILDFFEKSVLKNESFRPQIIKEIICNGKNNNSVQHYLDIE